MRNLKLNSKGFRVFTFGLLSVLLIQSFVAPSPASAATTNVSTFAQLQSALSTAANGDEIELTADIIVTSTLTLSRGVVIDGNNFTISVANPGINEDGTNASSPSNVRLFSVTSSNEATIKNATLIGGGDITAILVTGKLKLSSVRIERCRNLSSGGGAINNQGTLVVENSVFRRNSAGWGGAALNSGTLTIINTSFVENRTKGANAGGAIENQNEMWVNNSTFAHNFTESGGGAINNYGGNLRLSNSTFVGNVSTGIYEGGAILNFASGTVRSVSNLFAFNYSKNTSGQLVLDDFYNPDPNFALAVKNFIWISNSIVHSPTSDLTAGNLSSVTSYPGSANGSDDTLFTGGTYDYPTDGNGVVETAYGKVYRPNLLIQSGFPTAAIKSGNSTTGLNTGVPVHFTPTTIFGYKSGGSWTSWIGTATTQNVTTDQIGAARGTSSTQVGSVEGSLSTTYIVKSVAASGGNVSGASTFGDVYASGASVSVTALPSAGKKFDSWSISVNEGSPTTSTTNPLSITVTGNTKITPTFSNAASGTRTVTYSGYGSDSGAPPNATTATSSITIAANGGTLVKSGYYVAKWSTASVGAGTEYEFGSTYSTDANLTLYPVWVAGADPNASNTPTPAPAGGSSGSQSSSSTPSPSQTPTQVRNSSRASTPALASPSTTPEASDNGNTQVPVSEFSDFSSAKYVGFGLERPTNGKIIAVVGERAFDPIVTTTSIDTKVDLGSNGSLVIFSQDASGSTKPLNSDAVMQTDENSKVRVEASSFAPNSPVEVWLFSTPVRLGSGFTNSAGDFSGEFEVPTSVPEGRHSLQINGINKEKEITSIVVALEKLQSQPPSEISDREGTWGTVLVFGAIFGVVLVVLLFAARTRRRNLAD